MNNAAKTTNGAGQAGTRPDGSGIPAPLPRALPAAAGLGLGALVMAVLQDYPGVLQQVLAWGPTTLVLSGMFWLAAHLGPPFLRSQQDIAQHLGRLSGSIEQRFRQEDDVRMAVRALAAKVDEVLVEIRQKHEA